MMKMTMLALILATGCATVGGRPVQLFYAAPGGATPDANMQVESVKRSGRIRISAEAMAVIRSGSQVVLELFPDTRFTVATRRVTRSDGGVVTWNGSIAEARYFGAAMLALSDDGAYGTVQVDGRVFALRPGEDGSSLVFEIDQAGFPPEGTPVIAPRREPAETVAPPAAAATGGTLTVLLVLPQSYSSTCKKSKNLAKMAAAADANLNEVWSAFNYTARTSTYCTNYKPAGGDLGTDLVWLNADPGVAAARKANGANLVTMYVPKGTNCGLGYYNYPTVASDASFAFTVVEESCALENYSLAHEIGHNLGMQHDRYAEGGGREDLCNYGFTIQDSRLGKPTGRTVMAYATYCESLKLKCPRYGMYSYPPSDFSQFSFYFGIPCTTKKTGITGSANNSQEFIKAAPVASRW